mmetsp:Transcript_15619/g.22649  ORF Transcript_15619/g.22649 Transcript_15619/m.22649 type:complete len:92 (-) Transcript_15619:152-427(-)
MAARRAQENHLFGIIHTKLERLTMMMKYWKYISRKEGRDLEVRSGGVMAVRGWPYDTFGKYYQRQKFAGFPKHKKKTNWTFLHDFSIPIYE